MASRNGFEYDAASPDTAAATPNLIGALACARASRPGIASARATPTPTAAHTRTLAPRIACLLFRSGIEDQTACPLRVGTPAHSRPACALPLLHRPRDHPLD